MEKIKKLYEQVKNCKKCGKLTTNDKFCSPGCFYVYKTVSLITKKCLFCNKKIKCKKYSKQKFCSRKCLFKYYKTGKKLTKKHKEKIKINAKHNSNFGMKNKHHTEKSKIKISKTRLKRIKEGKIKPNVGWLKGKYGKLHPNFGKIFPIEIYPKMGFRTNINQVILINQKNKTGAWFNPEIQRKNRLNISKNRTGVWYFKNVCYESKSEMEFARNIHYQIEKLKLWKNYQFVINGKRIDFLVRKYKCFIEFHPGSGFRNETHKQYQQKRRKVLNDGGFKDYNLLIIS